FKTYKDIKLLPDVYYVDPEKRFFLYEYFDGATHVNRGNKADWMKLLVEGLFNYYEKYDPQAPWGRLGGTPRQNWVEFNRISLEYAYENIGDFLPHGDYRGMKKIVERLAEYERQPDKYLLHGDTGVHNFVFHHN